MTEKIKNNWFVILLPVVLSSLVSIMIIRTTYARDDDDTLNAKIESKIDKKEAIERIESGDAQTKYLLETYIQEGQKRESIILDRLESIDKKQDIIIEKSLK